MARFCSLFSGSSGNATYIGGAAGGVLIDTGVSAKRIAMALQEAEIKISDIQAIFITHEHSDHISGLRVFASRHQLPVYASQGTLDALEQAGHLNGKFSTAVIPLEGVEAAGMHIRAFRTSHDCRESCGYIIHTADQRKVAVCTDLGYLSDTVREAVSGCDIVMIESNHDVMMLQSGPYPYYLKRRILSENGHLSNTSCADALPEFIENGTTRLVLAHLSKENNYPDLAIQTARSSMACKGMHEGIDYILAVAPPVGGKVHIF